MAKIYFSQQLLIWISPYTITNENKKGIIFLPSSKRACGPQEIKKMTHKRAGLQLLKGPNFPNLLNPNAPLCARFGPMGAMPQIGICAIHMWPWWTV